MDRVAMCWPLFHFCVLGCFCSQCILWTPEPGKPMCDASRNQEACCSCWAVPNTQNTLQNFNQEVRILENSWTIQCIFGGLHFCCHAKRLTISFLFFLSAGSLRLIPFFKQYEMNQCMIHGKELRWHSVSPFTGHLFLAYLKEMPRLRDVLYAVRICY